jgi:tetratricopeptide (TPR) repeat protein
LCNAARRQCLENIDYALVLARDAILIAEALPDDYYDARAVNKIRGLAWKELAVVCGHRLDFASGYDALERAEQAYRQLVDPEEGMASVSLARAILLWRQGRYAEALPFAEKAATGHAAYQQSEKVAEAEEVVAVIRQRMGDIVGAIAAYKATYGLADKLDNWEMKARAASNLGVVFRDAGNFADASAYLLIALGLYESSDSHKIPLARARWRVARLSLSAGHFYDAAAQLEAVHRHMEERGMVGDAAKLKLDLAEAHLMLAHFEVVKMLCAELEVFFRQSGMATGAATAAAFLREAVALQGLTPHYVQHVRVCIQHVREYLRLLDDDPALPFLPLPSPEKNF